MKILMKDSKCCPVPDEWGSHIWDIICSYDDKIIYYDYVGMKKVLNVKKVSDANIDGDGPSR